MNWSTDKRVAGGRSSPPEGRAAQVPGWAFAAAAAFHLAVAAALGGVGTFDATSDGVSTSDAPRTVIRWLASPAEGAAPPASLVTDVGLASAVLRVEPEVSSEPGTVVPVVPVDPPQPQPAPQALAQPNEDVALPPVADALTPVAAPDAVEGYLPRKALTVPPSPLAHIALTWPPGMSMASRQAAVFTVFIDETGAVRRMVADGPTLLPSLEASARDTFTATRFAPGQVDGRPVKAMIRIEVVFDASVPASAAPAGPAPTVVSRQNL